MSFMSKDNVSDFLRPNVPLAMLTRLQLGGSAALFAEPPDEASLAELLTHYQGKKTVYVLGSGSNVLISEKDVDGVVVSLNSPAFCRIFVDGTTVTAGAGAKLNQVITQSVGRGLSGIEGLIGMPGTIGGAVHENVGSNNGNIEQWVKSVSVIKFDGTKLTLTGSDLSLWFQSGNFDNAVILSAALELERSDAAELTRRMQKFWIVRKSQQPTGELPSTKAFKNPRSGVSAEELITSAGLKGTKIGGAVICERNANFIIVEPTATVSDVLRLLSFVKDEVAKCCEIELEPAIEVWQ
jgi:UDP-N-acetylmuramate dehydrogenase